MVFNASMISGRGVGSGGGPAITTGSPWLIGRMGNVVSKLLEVAILGLFPPGGLGIDQGTSTPLLLQGFGLKCFTIVFRIPVTAVTGFQYATNLR
jgi:hypothetical protein